MEVAGSSEVRQIALGGAHGCALRADGTVRCWGANDSGQLGDGTTVPRSTTPVTVQGITDAVQIAAGDRFTCVRRASGALTCWGENEHGQLGDGTTSSRPTPAPVTAIAGAQSIAAGNAGACARLQNGSVRCWGIAVVSEPETVFAANVTIPRPVAGLAGVTAIHLGGFTGFAAAGDGRTHVWGEDVTIPFRLSTVKPASP